MISARVARTAASVCGSRVRRAWASSRCCVHGGRAASEEKLPQTARPVLLRGLEGLANEGWVASLEILPVASFHQRGIDLIEQAFGSRAGGVIGRRRPAPGARQARRDSQVLERFPEAALFQPNPAAEIIDFPRRYGTLATRGQLHGAVQQRRSGRQVALRQAQMSQVAIRALQIQPVQFSDAVGLQKGCFRFRKVATLQKLFAKPVPAKGVELEVAGAIGTVGSLAEQLGRFRHAVLARAQDGQLDQELGQVVAPVLAGHALQGAFDPLHRGFQFSHFGVERCDVDIQHRGVAGVAGPIGQPMRLQEGP